MVYCERWLVVLVEGVADKAGGEGGLSHFGISEQQDIVHAIDWWFSRQSIISWIVSLPGQK